MCCSLLMLLNLHVNGFRYASREGYYNSFIPIFYLSPNWRPAQKSRAKVTKIMYSLVVKFYFYALK